jgi:hypothetical protein
MKKSVFAALGLLCISAMPALADGPRVYAYQSNDNFCPAGLQPITLNGVICCGTPNQSLTYQQMMRTPARRVRYSGSMSCPVGQKGCN